MAIPVGTTSRQVGTIALWMFIGVVVVGTLTWWWPGYHAWGALGAALLAVWTVWLIWQMVSGRRTVAANPAHLALLAPVVLLTVHSVNSGIVVEPHSDFALSGAISMSLLFQFGLLLLGIMLSQSLLSEAIRHVSVLGACGAAMMGGALAALCWGVDLHERSALAFVGFGGLGVWLSALWGNPGDRPCGARALRSGLARAACGAVAAVAVVILAGAAPTEAAISAGVVAATLIVAGMVFPGRNVLMLTFGAALAAGIAICAWVFRPEFAALNLAAAGPWGRGEEGFAGLTGGDAGGVILLQVVGWGPMAWMLAVLVAGMVRLLVRARKFDRSEAVRTILWTAATGVTTCALLARAGLAIPAVTLAVAFVWGLLPAMLAQPGKSRSGLSVLVFLVGFVLLLGLARNDGLMVWAASSLGAGDKVLHAVLGFFLAMVLIWQMGARRVWAGLLGVLAAIAISGIGEAAQGNVAWRSEELGDWIAGAIGSLAALAPYLLSAASRWCESPDARSASPSAHDGYPLD